MSTEYKLSYTAVEIDERLGKIDSIVTSVNGIAPDEHGNVNVDVPENEPLVVNLSADGTTDKNIMEIVTAWTKNRQVLASMGDDVIALTGLRGNSAFFSGVVNAKEVAIVVTGNTYEITETDLATEQYVKDYAQPKGNYLTEHQSLEGYATEQFVRDGYQPKGDYLTAVPDGYAKTEDIPTKPEDIGAQPAGDYLTEVPDGYAKIEDIPTKPEDIGAQPAGNYLTEHQSLAGYATENYVKNQIAEAELSGGDVDLSGYATKDELPTKVSQLQNDSGYLTAVPDGYAKSSDIPTKPEDIGAQPAGNYLTEHQSLDGYAKTSDIPTKVSQLTNDKGYLTEHQSLDGYAKTSDIPTKPSDIGAQPAGNYALKTEIPNVPVQSVNGKTGAVQLNASDVGALPSTYTPPTQTAAQVGADPKGTATSAVSQHNTADDSHNDIRLELKAINDRLTAFFDSDNQTLDELSEIVTYITNNKSLIDSITTSKVSVADIVNNLTSNVANKPLSAAQGVALKSLIDGVSNSLANYQPKGDYLTSFTETDPTVPSWAKASSKPSYSKSEVGLGNVDNVKQYSASNPPPYPVTSVNGKTGEVTLDAAAVGALPASTTIPTKVSQLQNDSGYLTQHQDISGKLDASALPTAINTALTQAKTSGEFDGQRGTGLLSVTTAPSSYTTAVGGITPKYRMAISTIKTQAGVTEVLLGDTIRYSYYQYPIDYLDASYAYFTTRISIRGTTGTAGKDYSFDPTVYRLPILHLTGDTTGMTKETEVTLSYECNDKNGTAKTGSCTMKWQGSSSLAWDKKNYTIKFDNAFEVVDGWGSQKKYCLKANWIDHSHSRNVVSAKLWGLVRKNRSNLPTQLKGLPNAGAIDGFPVIIMLNGEFHGLYSWNIPKDAWMFGMGSGTKEAIVGADNQAEDTAFKAETLLDADGWELEYNASGFSETAVKDSLNNLIRACINTTGSDLDTIVAQYLDWESAIDYYIFAVILQGGDMITKNTILATFDGVKWYFSAYDMDTTYGLEFDGSGLVRAVTTSHTTFETIAETHRVFELIKRFKTNELKARYNALRTNELSESRICNYFENYAWDISSPLLVEEVKKWPSVRGSAVNGIDQICRWVRQRLEVTDKWINALPVQETPVEPEQPVEIINLVPTSIDTDGSIYNGVGYKNNTRLSSSGSVSGSAQDNSCTTGFMPWKSKGVIRIKGADFFNADDSKHYYACFYKADKSLNYYFEVNATGAGTGAFSFIKITKDSNGITTVDTSGAPGGTAISDAIINSAFFRITVVGSGENLIITVNQEITA